MNNQTILEMVKVSLEQGAKISVQFYHLKEKEAAEEMARALSDMIDIPYTKNEYSGANWFEVTDYKQSIEIIIHFNMPTEFMIEDIDFGGDGIAI